VARTADGQKFRQSLNDAKENGLDKIDFNAPLKMSNSKVPDWGEAGTLTLKLGFF